MHSLFDEQLAPSGRLPQVPLVQIGIEAVQSVSTQQLLIGTQTLEPGHILCVEAHG
jgi:hypothetical protein